ncbi:MAG: GHKL domain-containing protein [Lachnospiraceae bacterium]|nr:GHKL domain-containing protein [Lachnospiraceae bacterium]
MSGVAIMSGGTTALGSSGTESMAEESVRNRGEQEKSRDNRRRESAKKSKNPKNMPNYPLLSNIRYYYRLLYREFPRLAACHAVTVIGGILLPFMGILMPGIVLSQVSAGELFRGLALIALAGGVIVWFVSTKITKPILELNRISEKMVHLDFEAKYEGGARNEIGLLGENINKLSASLERSISELKTANNELQKDIERKEQIDAMRREFLANVSHELKTPIALIQGYAEGLSEGVNDDPESRSFYCEVIVDEASRMNNMVKKLLTLNQLEFGNDVVAMERFDVAALVKNYVQSAGILTRQNEITVRMEEYGPVYAWGDVYKTEEVFMNYFSNAVNHCRAVAGNSDKLIVVSLEQREGKVRIGVFNTGQPIPEESVPHLWEKFYKVDKARTREYGGSGVGLSIVKAIMESMNQKYGVENYNNGVLFWFELDGNERS